LASGSKLFLEGLHRILENDGDIKIVAHASSPEEVERCFTKIKPKVLLIDNRALELSTQKLSNLIAKASSDTTAILFGNHLEGESAIPGAVYVTKDTSSLALIRIIKSVSAGAQAKEGKRADDIKNQFTKTEMKIIDSVAECLSNRDIAKKLSISDKTVKAHLSNIFTKLDIESRYQLIIYARKLKAGSV
jgi:DNA-binding NarL/FixJ family response regulator